MPLATHQAPPARAANRGPAAAAENRAALLAAAREAFAQEGIGVPLVTIARRAGVGQGSLYRHFPDRVSLAVAVFEQNVAELEALAGRTGATLRELLRLLSDHIVQSQAFVDLVRAAPSDGRLEELAARVQRVLGERLRDGDDAAVPAGLTDRDLLLAVAMVAGAVSGAAPREREELAARAWRLLGFDLG